MATPPRTRISTLRSEAEETIDVEIDPSYEIQLPLPIHIERSFGTYDSSYVFEKGHQSTRRLVKFAATKIPADQWKQLESFEKLVDRNTNAVPKVKNLPRPFFKQDLVRRIKNG